MAIQFPGSSAYSPTQFSQQPNSSIDAGGLDQMLGSLEQLLGGQGAQGGGLAQILDQIKKALESGQLSPQDAMQQLSQLFQQVQQGQGAAQPGSGAVSGAGGPSAAGGAGFSPVSQFQGQPQAGQVEGHHHHGHHKAMKAAAEALGESPQELRQQLDQGLSLNDIAQQKGIDPSTVANAVKSTLASHMNSASPDELDQITQRIMSHQRQPQVDPNAETIPASQLQSTIEV